MKYLKHVLKGKVILLVEIDFTYLNLSETDVSSSCIFDGLHVMSVA